MPKLWLYTVSSKVSMRHYIMCNLFFLIIDGNNWWQITDTEIQWSNGRKVAKSQWDEQNIVLDWNNEIKH